MLAIPYVHHSYFCIEQLKLIPEIIVMRWLMYPKFFTLTNLLNIEEGYYNISFVINIAVKHKSILVTYFVSKFRTDFNSFYSTVSFIVILSIKFHQFNFMEYITKVVIFIYT